MPMEGIYRKWQPTRSGKRGPHRSPAQRVRWGEGGDPEHSRRKSSRKKRLLFLSRAEGSKTGTPREPSKAGRVGKRRKEAADMEFSRLLRKPRKRNGAAFFRRGRVVQKRCQLPGRKMGSPSKQASMGKRRRPGAQPKKKQTQQAPAFSEPCGEISDVVPVAGVEPARCRQRWILSPLRLPIPSYRQIAGVL